MQRDIAIGHMILAAEKEGLPTAKVESLVRRMARQISLDDDAFFASEAVKRYEDLLERRAE
ncbi:hypothetical protein J41TS12_11090 [Paenibacillus antibioticophila]|uniref:Uncharacterized protein n=1 Tax=Paenibacillus antibioticophila TaxID=1274374 RepID=A0A919XRL4_9BACL|nr:hypothetical protein [Paenibacillus antibioticophila]GIO36248.1 hypothetical protein J41TS12_11090 [Paenibacillus antibioticophila]